MKEKEAFELYAKGIGVMIQTYRTDNRIFKAYTWVMTCRGKGQSLTFSVVNAHHISGISERRIRTLR